MLDPTHEDDTMNFTGESTQPRVCELCQGPRYCWACSTCGRDLCNACYRGHAVDCVGLEGGQ